MKKFKKMMALAIAMVMVLSMSISVFAANHEISTTNTKHTYEIYQIFTGTVDNGKLTSLKYGQNTKGRTIGDPVSQGDVETLNGIADAGNTAALDQADIAAIIPFVDITGNPIAEVGKDKEASASVPGWTWNLLHALPSEYERGTLPCDPPDLDGGGRKRAETGRRHSEVETKKRRSRLLVHRARDGRCFASGAARQVGRWHTGTIIEKRMKKPQVFWQMRTEGNRPGRGMAGHE